MCPCATGTGTGRTGSTRTGGGAQQERTESLIHRPEAYEAVHFAVDLIYRQGGFAFNQQPWTEVSWPLTLAHPNSVQSWRKTLNFEWNIAPLWTRKGAGSTPLHRRHHPLLGRQERGRGVEPRQVLRRAEAETERIVKNGRTPALKSLQDEYVKILDSDQPPATASSTWRPWSTPARCPSPPPGPRCARSIGEQLAGLGREPSRGSHRRDHPPG